MLTDKEMLSIAEKFLKKIGNGIEIMIEHNETIKKPYGNFYRYNSKESIQTGNFNKSLVGNAPILVEKEKGRVVRFSTSGIFEKEIEDYENGNMIASLHTFWYPEEDRFDYK
jgi:hypothetical protein